MNAAAKAPETSADNGAIRLLTRINDRLSDDDVSTAPLDAQSARAALSWLRGMFGAKIRAVLTTRYAHELTAGDAADELERRRIVRQLVEWSLTEDSGRVRVQPVDQGDRRLAEIIAAAKRVLSSSEGSSNG